MINDDEFYVDEKQARITMLVKEHYVRSRNRTNTNKIKRVNNHLILEDVDPKEPPIDLAVYDAKEYEVRCSSRVRDLLRDKA